MRTLIIVQFLCCLLLSYLWFTTCLDKWDYQAYYKGAMAEVEAVHRTVGLRSNSAFICRERKGY